MKRKSESTRDENPNIPEDRRDGLIAVMRLLEISTGCCRRLAAGG